MKTNTTTKRIVGFCLVNGVAMTGRTFSPEKKGGEAGVQ